jgi:quercetin 2,3-dioxygenase
LKVGSARVIAGKVSGTQGPASTFSPVQVWDVSLPHKDARVDFPIDSTHNCVLFVRRGRVEVLKDGMEGSLNNKNHVLGLQDVAILDRNDGNTVALRVLEADSSVMVLSGEPLEEEIAHHGPFVMNTQDEIRKAFSDYRSGKFGRE